MSNSHVIALRSTSHSSHSSSHSTSHISTYHPSHTTSHTTSTYHPSHSTTSHSSGGSTLWIALFVIAAIVAVGLGARFFLRRRVATP